VTLENSEYEQEVVNLSEFKQPSSDTKGHSERLSQTRVHPSTARQVGEIIQSSIWPYKTTTDFIRHAIYRHIKWLDSIGPIQFHDTAVDAVRDILREEDEHRTFLDSMEKLKSEIDFHVSNGRDEHAKKILARIQSHISLMPDEESWKAIYQKELDEKFGHLLEEMPTVRLFEGA